MKLESAPAKDRMRSSRPVVEESPLGIFKLSSSCSDEEVEDVGVIETEVEAVLGLLHSDDEATKRHAIIELHDRIRAGMTDENLSPDVLQLHIRSVIEYAMQHVPGRTENSDAFAEANFLISVACASPDGALHVGDTAGLYFLLAVLESAAIRLPDPLCTDAVDNVLFAIWIQIAFPSGANVSEYNDSMTPIERIVVLLQELLQKEREDRDDGDCRPSHQMLAQRVRSSSDSDDTSEPHSDEECDDDPVVSTSQRDEHILCLLIAILDAAQAGHKHSFQILLLNMFKTGVELLSVDVMYDRRSFCERRLAAMRILLHLMHQNSVEFTALGGTAAVAAVLAHAAGPRDGIDVESSWQHQSHGEVTAALQLTLRTISLANDKKSIQRRLFAENYIQLVARHVAQTDLFDEGEQRDKALCAINVLAFLCDDCENEAQVAVEVASVRGFVEGLCMCLRRFPYEELHRCTALMWLVAMHSLSGRQAIMEHALQTLVDLRRKAPLEGTTRAATALQHNIVGCLAALECFDSSNSLLAL